MHQRVLVEKVDRLHALKAVDCQLELALDVDHSRIDNDDVDVGLVNRQLSCKADGRVHARHIAPDRFDVGMRVGGANQSHALFGLCLRSTVHQHASAVRRNRFRRLKAKATRLRGVGGGSVQRESTIESTQTTRQHRSSNRRRACDKVGLARNVAFVALCNLVCLGLATKAVDADVVEHAVFVRSTPSNRKHKQVKTDRHSMSHHKQRTHVTIT